MTVSIQRTKRTYAGNGLTRTWSVDFPLCEAEDLRVFLTSPAGVETEITTDFALNAAADTLTYPTEASGKSLLASGWKITLVRQTPQTQGIDLLRQGELDAEVLEKGYDRLTLQVQELSERIDRCIKYPVSAQSFNIDPDTVLADIFTAQQSAQVSAQAAAASAQTADTYAQTADTYAQSATASAQAAQGSATQAAQALSGRADTGLSNLTDAGKIEAAKMFAPSTTYDALTVGSTGGSYTAPANGYFCAIGMGVSNNVDTWLELQNTTAGNLAQGVYGHIMFEYKVFLPVQKGDNVVLTYNNISFVSFRFIYAQGSISEAA
ncbi:MAG: hypothetical protein MJ053_03795 [Elusimicrobiaceae bacterium]|nr:hypothetical protein [Elusimicrobiaceae bacterium]